MLILANSSWQKQMEKSLSLPNTLENDKRMPRRSTCGVAVFMAYQYFRFLISAAFSWVKFFCFVIILKGSFFPAMG
jgi:hypothetical protein